MIACMHHTLTAAANTDVLQELQEQWERARNDEQSRGAGAADVKRWTGIRNIVEARELLRTLFVSACSQKAQVRASSRCASVFGLQAAAATSYMAEGLAHNMMHRLLVV